MRRSRTIVVALVLAACRGPRPGLEARPAVPVERYAFAPRSAAHDEGAPIDLASENRAASARLLALDAKERARRPLIVVPGFAAGRALDLHGFARLRVELAAKEYAARGGLAILVSGGNVHPRGTPFNEALGMKRHLVRELGISGDEVVLEPYARHTTTNLRNAARFMLAHEIREALVATTPEQTFYLTAGGAFERRCVAELGYRLGTLSRLTSTVTRFVPAREVLRRGEDPQDP